MKRFMSLSMAALLATTMVVLSFSQADARHRRHRGVGAGVAAGVIGGLIVGGAIANAERRRYREPRRYRSPPRRYRGDAHENWCYNRYRSYRAYDNTYQPYRGGRRYCRSPYG